MQRAKEKTRLRFALAVLGALAVGLGALSMAGAAQPATLTGTITSEATGAIVLTTSGGTKTVKTTNTTNFITRSPAQLADIKAHDFIGVDAKKHPDGSLSAVSINIFPSSWEGKVREGQWLMASGDTMTNAVVTEYVTAVSGRTLTMTYQGATWKIAVPPSAAIHRLTAITRGELRPQMRAMVRGTANPDGSVTATSIVVDQSMAH